MAQRISWTDLNADLFENDAAVTSHAVTVDTAGDFTGLGIRLLYDNDLCQFVCLLTGQLNAAVAEHAGDQTVGNIVKDKNFFFCNAGKVVVEGAAVDDVLCCLFDVGSIVHNDRRVAGTGTDCLLTGGEHSLYHTGAAGADQQTDGGMLVHHLCGVHGGLAYRCNQYLRARLRRTRHD